MDSRLVYDENNRQKRVIFLNVCLIKNLQSEMLQGYVSDDAVTRGVLHTFIGMKLDNYLYNVDDFSFVSNVMIPDEDAVTLLNLLKKHDKISLRALLHDDLNYDDDDALIENIFVRNHPDKYEVVNDIEDDGKIIKLSDRHIDKLIKLLKS